MGFKQDYMERLIKNIGDMVVALVGGKDAIESNIDKENFDLKISEDDWLEMMVKKNVVLGNLNETEDMIFQALDNRKTKKIYDIAVYFYSTIYDFSDDKLEQYNFPREEVIRGLKEVRDTLGFEEQ